MITTIYRVVDIKRIPCCFSWGLVFIYQSSHTLSPHEPSGNMGLEVFDEPGNICPKDKQYELLFHTRKFRVFSQSLLVTSWHYWLGYDISIMSPYNKSPLFPVWTLYRDASPFHAMCTAYLLDMCQNIIYLASWIM